MGIRREKRLRERGQPAKKENIEEESEKKKIHNVIINKKIINNIKHIFNNIKCIYFNRAMEKTDIQFVVHIFAVQHVLSL